MTRYRRASHRSAGLRGAHTGRGAGAVAQDIAPARTFARRGFRPAARRLGTMRVSSRAMSGFRLDLADGFFQRQALAGDLGFGEGRLHAAQLRDQRRAGTLIQGTPAFP
ncbi:hypothetical protein GCM10022626_04920 [[Pseudomonas] carboxydohydrogena]